MKTHVGIEIGGRMRYLCNEACNTTERKIAKRGQTINCQNCVRIISNQFDNSWEKLREYVKRRNDENNQ